MRIMRLISATYPDESNMIAGSSTLLTAVIALVARLTLFCVRVQESRSVGRNGQISRAEEQEKERMWNIRCFAQIAR